MSEYVLFTDSNTDLPADLVQQLDLSVIPMLFEMDGKSYYNYPDNHEMDPKEFYAALRGGKVCTTSQVSPSRFDEIFSPVLESGRDILYLCFSSGLSGTYNTSRLAVEELREKFPDRKIRTVDTLAASMGQGLLVYLAAKKRQEGMGLDELGDWVEENRLKLCHWFTVDNLMFLKRGGRVSGAAAVMGTMLGIKPVLHVDDEGHLIPMEKVRGRRASLDALVKHMQATAIRPAEQTVFISHGDCQADCDYVAQQLREKLGVKEIVTSYIGPVIGAHSGPGTVALFFVGEKR
ncbi:MAG TPA: DegV family protein [Candidatus Anaerofilum faecale]|nr:DegV family protein [Candidatus Anaerofilum faecale]